MEFSVTIFTNSVNSEKNSKAVWLPMASHILQRYSGGSKPIDRYLFNKFNSNVHLLRDNNSNELYVTNFRNVPIARYKKITGNRLTLGICDHSLNSLIR